MLIITRFSGTKAGVSSALPYITQNGTDCIQVRENIQLVKEIAKAHKSGEFEFAVNPEEQKTLWSARKESLWSMLALRREGDEVWSTDVAVPISRLPDIIGTQRPFFRLETCLQHYRNIQERDGRSWPVCKHSRPHRRRQLPREYYVQQQRSQGASSRRKVRARHGRSRTGDGRHLHRRTRHWTWKEGFPPERAWPGHHQRDEEHQGRIGSVLAHESRKDHGRVGVNSARYLLWHFHFLTFLGSTFQQACAGRPFAIFTCIGREHYRVSIGHFTVATTGVVYNSAERRLSGGFFL
jgi:hypothetical protein